MSWEDDLAKFIRQTTEEIVDIQKDVANAAMSSLFNHSPHHILLHKNEDKQEYTDAEKQQYAKDQANGTAKSKKSKYRRSMYALSEYDANHKVSTSYIGQSEFTPATMSRAVSAAVHFAEGEKIDSVSELGDTIIIENISGHRKSVEDGSGWNEPGYYPYSKTVSTIRAKFQGVLK